MWGSHTVSRNLIKFRNNWYWLIFTVTVTKNENGAAKTKKINLFVGQAEYILLNLLLDRVIS